MKTIGVVGCGLMGAGIVQVCAVAGYKTTVSEVSEDLVELGIGRISKSIQKAVDREKLTAEQAEQVRSNIHGTTNLEDMSDCDLVIEAVTEVVDEKKKIFKELDRITKPEALLAVLCPLVLEVQELREHCASLSQAPRPRAQPLHRDLQPVFLRMSILLARAPLIPTVMI